jgi:hypothetical protein
MLPPAVQFAKPYSRGTDIVHSNIGDVLLSRISSDHATRAISKYGTKPMMV